MDRLARLEPGNELECLLGTDDAGIASLETALTTILGQGARRVGDERLKKGIHRLIYLDGELPSLVVKQLDPVVAYRSRKLEQSWLPALELSMAGPGLLATVTSPTAALAWQIFRDLGNHGLDRNADDTAAVDAAVATIARIHRRFTEHPLLAEARLWGGDLGTHWYRSNVRDARRAVEALASGAGELPEPTRAACDRLIERLTRFEAEARERAELWREIDGRETLLHGDLWTKNVFALPPARPGEPVQVRLIDWDHVAVGPVAYDLSTFLMRFEMPRRLGILRAYEAALDRDGFRPTVAEWNRLFDTAETARIANRVIWPALALLGNDSELESWAHEQLVEVDSWFETLCPVVVETTAEDAP